MFFLSSFLPRSFYPAYVTTKHTSTKHRVAVAVSLSSARVRALLSFISLEHHAFRASKSVLGLCHVVCFAGLASLPCKALFAGRPGCLGCLLAAALQAVAGGADCGSESEEGADGWESGLTGGWPGAIWVF